MEKDLRLEGKGNTSPANIKEFASAGARFEITVNSEAIQVDACVSK